MNIQIFIDELRNSDEYIRHIYTQGGCYRFYVLLSKMYKGCVPYIIANKTSPHIITRYRGKYYDINGEVSNVNGYVKLKEEDIPMVEKWSFHRHNLLKITECPYCDEPITY